VTSLLSTEDLSAWGWRIPFLLGAAFALVGLVLRRRVTETPVFAAHQAAQDGKARPVRCSGDRQRFRLLSHAGDPNSEL
jgi:MHS family proline/betaine transporter-like MFS transporter